MTIYGHTMSYSNYHMPYGHTLYCIWLVYECYFLILSPITIVYSICLQAGPTNKHNSGCDPYSELTRDYPRVSACGRINPYSECRNRSKQTGIRENKGTLEWGETGTLCICRGPAPTLSFSFSSLLDY